MQKYGLLANAEQSAVESPPCQICDTSRPTYSWTDYSGEATCTRCGTAYQIKWGELREGEAYPRINVKEKFIPVLRRYWAETGKQNGSGTFLGFDEYPEAYRGRVAFGAWWKEHKSEYPELASQCKEEGE